METKVNVLGREWVVVVPESLIARAVGYAVGVVGQRETAGMGEGVTEEKVAAVKERFARIAKGEWSEGGGRKADPVMRALRETVVRAAIRAKASTAYKAEDVPGASDAKELSAFVAAHFTKDAAAKLLAHAAKIAKARETDVL